MSLEYMIRIRLTILFSSLLSLAVTSLCLANARFAVILRDRARSDYTNTPDDILDNTFQSLQSNILVNMVVAAIAATAFGIFGAVITVHPRLLQKPKEILSAYVISEIFLAFVMIGTGGHLADSVHGFQASFKKFGANDSIPYYSIMYFGGITQATYGSVLIFLTTTVVLVIKYVIQ